MRKHRMWSGASFVLVKFSARVPQNYEILNRFIAYQFYTRGRISTSHRQEMHYKKSNCETKKSSFSWAKINDKFLLWLIFIWLYLTAKVFTGRYPDFKRRVTLNVSWYQFNPLPPLPHFLKLLSGTEKVLYQLTLSLQGTQKISQPKQRIYIFITILHLQQSKGRHGLCWNFLLFSEASESKIKHKGLKGSWCPAACEKYYCITPLQVRETRGNALPCSVLI